ncbi:hypothetical protein C8Q80DRAFT_1168698 [Daedaleopsis nitida]|nr:hypothetical protein C8Q80DRAFT_1168698 [Daedaleopsis nitida]
MVAWQDPSVVAFCAFIYNQIAVFLLGFLGNHVITRMDIEWSLLTRKRRFNPVLLPYLFGRYSILVTLIAFVVTNRFRPRVACDATYKSLALLGSAASYCSTLNLGIRTYIIWKDMNRFVVWVLSFGCVAHAVLVAIQASMSVTFAWDEQLKACYVVQSSNITMFVFYLYTILMDLAILVLTICGLWRKAALKSAIGGALSEQCLWYCMGTFICNIPAVVLPMMNLNLIMNVIASMPATTFSVIMSSAAVLSLQPEEIPETTGQAVTQVRDPPRPGILLGVVAPTSPHQHVTLTTNIVLESRADSAAITSFGTRSSKYTEETGANAV